MHKSLYFTNARRGKDNAHFEWSRGVPVDDTSILPAAPPFW